MSFFNKKAVILVVAVLTVFLLAASAAQKKYQFPFMERVVATVVSPFEFVMSKIGYSIRSVSTSTSQLINVYKENEALRAENTDLRQRNINIEEIAAENVRLQNLLNYKKQATQFDFVVAAVIARDPGAWTSIIMINRGTSDGVKKDMPVVTPQGLVGNVTQAFEHTAKVQLILDPRSAVGTIVQRPESRVAAIVEGNSANTLAPKMVNVSRDADIVQGDRIVTSGFGGIYPKGLLVGEVVDVVNEEGGLLKYAVLKPSVDFDRLEEVLVIVQSREPAPSPPQPTTPQQQPPATNQKGTTPPPASKGR